MKLKLITVAIHLFFSCAYKITDRPPFLSFVCLSCIIFPFSPNVTAPRTCVPFDKMIALFIFHSLWSALLHPRLSPIIPLIWVQPRLIRLILPSRYFGTTTLPFPFFSSPFSMDYLFSLYLHTSCRWYICAAHSSISSENAKSTSWIYIFDWLSYLRKQT